jgi:hypothetical protein
MQESTLNLYIMTVKMRVNYATSLDFAMYGWVDALVCLKLSQ